MILLTLLALAAASDVSVYTKSNFDDAIKGESLVMVKFFAPWCGHCKRLAPEYEKAATALKSKAVLAKVDCVDTVNSGLCARFGVQGYPTLKVFMRRGVEEVDYSGGRTSEDIVEYMTKMSEPPYTTISTAEELAALTKSGVVVVGVFSGDTSAESSVFDQLARSLRV